VLGAIRAKVRRRVRASGLKKQEIRISPAAIMHRLRQRLISHSVGKRQLGKTIKGPLPYSWCAGFHVLNGQQFVTSQLRQLDRGREKQMCRVQRALKKVSAPNTEGRRGTGYTPLDFYGSPFSYSKQFTHASPVPVVVGAGGRSRGGSPNTGGTGGTFGPPKGKRLWELLCELARRLWRLIRSGLYGSSD
jgi:hypothetical protein